MNIGGAPAATIIFLVTIGISLMGLYRNREIIEKMILHPYSMFSKGEWYRLITSGFVHGDMMHLMFNMFTFYFFAFSLERGIGSLEFVLIYFISMVISDIKTVIRNRHNYGYRSLGASGAISGILFSMILLVPQMEVGMLILPIRIPAPIFGGLYLLYCWYAARNASDYINHDAHLWGALGGLISTIILFPGALPGFMEYLGSWFY